MILHNQQTLGFKLEKENIELQVLYNRNQRVSLFFGCALAFLSWCNRESALL